MSTTSPPPSTASQHSTRFGWPVLAWSLWDCGSAAFNAVITTFVFTVYLTTEEFFGPRADQQLGWVLAAAGFAIAVLAPVAGLRADRSGRRTYWLAVNTAAVVVISAALFFVAPDPDYLWLGLLLLACGHVFFELAEVNYHAMLTTVATPRNIGRVSGFGWGLGYIGGIVLLLIVYFGLINPDVGVFGITGENGMDVRVTMLICAGWTLLFSLPVIFTVRDDVSARQRQARLGVLGSYKLLGTAIRDVWRRDHHLVYFLGASAVFRDGLAGVFTFGGIIALGTFGFTAAEVIMFGVVANLVAGLATVAFGAVDDRIGPKKVIVGCLSAMIAAGIAIFVLHDAGKTAFWVLGLLLCVFVGPVQSASRTLLARTIPRGREGEIFGLYATTGRAVSFLAPAAFSTAIALGAGLTGAADDDRVQQWGVLGIVAVLLVGLLLVIPVNARSHPAPVPTPAS